MQLMFSAYEIMVAARYLRARRTDGFISVIAWFSLIGIALGVATLIIVMSVMNGFRQELLQRVLGINGHITVQSTSATGGIMQYEDIMLRIRKDSEVTQAFPLVEGQVMAVGNGQTRGAILQGMRQQDIKAYHIIANNIVLGSLKKFEERRNVVLGERLAHALGVTVGDDVSFVSAKGRSTVVGSIPRSSSFRVIALFNIGMFEYDSSIALASLSQAQSYFLLPGQVSKIKIFIGNPDLAEKHSGTIRSLLDGEANAFSWQQAHSHFFSALKVERNVMFLILTLIILVAAFNIISSLIMLVNDKGKSIAIMRTIGATRGMITRIFLLTGSAVGALGTFLGVVLGLTFSINIDLIRSWIEQLSGTELWSPEIRFLSQLPAIVDPSEVVSIVLMSLSLSLLATLYPAWRAARLDPVDALRYE